MSQPSAKKGVFSPGTNLPVSFNNTSSDSLDMNSFLIRSVPTTNRSSTYASTYNSPDSWQYRFGSLLHLLKPNFAVITSAKCSCHNFGGLSQSVHRFLQFPKAIPIRIEFLWRPHEHFSQHCCMQEGSAHISQGDSPVSRSAMHNSNLTVTSEGVDAKRLSSSVFSTF